MVIRLDDGDLHLLAARLDEVADRTGPAKLVDISGSVTTAMPGTQAGAAMAAATSRFDRAVVLLAQELAEHADAARSAHRDFTITDDHGAERLSQPQWGNDQRYWVAE